MTSMRRQLEYLLDLATGKSVDRSRLPDIVLGIQTVRELDGHPDEELVETLFWISEAFTEL